ncbi:MAG: 50S ribosomal protein L28 [Phycisphaerae bacterium]|nr:50S ribosomal protein L28 [Phycisphaerae bacterium]
MPRRCPLTGKQTRSGRMIARRGKAKYLGGVGRKITGKTKRKFKANMQRVRAVIDGRVVRINVSAKAVRKGMIQKPSKRNYTPPDDQEAKQPENQEAKETEAHE